MDKFELIGIGMFVAICLIAIPIAKVFYRWMFAIWKELALAYPGGPLKYERSIRFTSMTLLSDTSLHLGRIVHLSSTSEFLGLSISLFGDPEILIPRSAVIRSIDTGGSFIVRQEVSLKNCSISLVFRGRSARFVRRWWSNQ